MPLDMPSCKHSMLALTGVDRPHCRHMNCLYTNMTYLLLPDATPCDQAHFRYEPWRAESLAQSPCYVRHLQRTDLQGVSKTTHE